ncbi:MAG: N-acetyltransferase [Planctomycetes bacterium]|nr:N-acetyltransferase [Planctomycetota bacterium]
MTLEIKSVGGVLGRLAFLRAAAAVRREPQFTPDVSLDFFRQTSPKNPFFRHAQIKFFIAKRDGRVVGRAAATVDDDANAYFREKVVKFGFFECADGETEAARALIEASADFGRARGMQILRGPVDMSMNFKIGMLIEGFDRPPAVLMNWNPPSYNSLVESLGFQKEKDVVAMEVTREVVDVERYKKLARRVLDRGGLRVRSFETKHFGRELELMRTIFNKAWADNWGFMPVSREEFEYEAHGLKDVLIPEMGCFIERDGETVAFSLSIPDAAVAVREIRGRLLPFGWYKLLKRIKTIDRVRMILLGILPEFRRHGIDALLYFETFRRAYEKGMTTAEFGWILEDNELIIKGCEACGAKITKRYRIYKKSI